jgi:hypothetical protein
MERTERGHNTRAQWTEAESLVFSKLRSGIHPQILEGQIREQLRLPLHSYYRQSYLLHALRILRNLCNNNAFAYLPTLQQYQKLKRDCFLLTKFKVDMNDRFSDDKYLHRIATEGAIESKFCTSPWLKQTSVAANLPPTATCPEFDEEAKELIKSMEEGAARNLEQQHMGTLSASFNTIITYIICNSKPISDVLFL